MRCSSDNRKSPTWASPYLVPDLANLFKLLKEVVKKQSDFLGEQEVPGKYPEKVKHVLNLCSSAQVLCFSKKECDSMWRLSGWSWSLRFSGWPLSGIYIKSPHCHWGQQHPNWKRTGINCLRRLRDNSIEERSWFKQTTNPWSLLWRTVSCVLRRGCKECYCSYRSLSLE